MVRPQLEFASIVWDPIYNNDAQRIESIQRTAPRWALRDYSKHSSVTSMLQRLSWPELQTRRKISRLQTFHKLYTMIFLYLYLPITSQWLEKLGNSISTISYYLYHLLQPTKEVSLQEQYKNGTPYHNLSLI